jgi:predicted phosphoribosyltransferase
VDQLVALAAVDALQSVGRWYERFQAVEDEEVQALLAAARSRSG